MARECSRIRPYVYSAVLLYRYIQRVMLALDHVSEQCACVTQHAVPFVLFAIKQAYKSLVSHGHRTYAVHYTDEKHVRHSWSDLLSWATHDWCDFVIYLTIRL